MEEHQSPYKPAKLKKIIRKPPNCLELRNVRGPYDLSLADELERKNYEQKNEIK